MPVAPGACGRHDLNVKKFTFRSWSLGRIKQWTCKIDIKSYKNQKKFVTTFVISKCISCFIESRTVEFVFLWFFYDFTSSLFNAPWAPGPKCNFFIFRSCRPLGGRQAPIFENFPIWHIFLNFFKYKNEKALLALSSVSAL